MGICFFTVLVIFSCCIISLQINSQSNTFNKETPVLSATKLIGKWYPVDKNASAIQFVDSAVGFTLTGTSANHFYYLSKDSLGNVSSSGYYPMWPSPSCSLSFISADTLKVNYSTSMDEGIDFYQTRKKPLNKK